MSEVVDCLREKNREFITEYEFNKRIGSLVKEKRENFGLTQEELAELIGTYRQRIIFFEQGKGGLINHELFIISKILGINADIFYESINRGKTTQKKSELGFYERKFYYLLRTAKFSESVYKYLSETIHYIKGKEND